ncbi:MAG: hypothetical protein AABY26_01440 [Nanoarchaeota archaeon]
MKKLLTAALLNLALTSCGNYSWLRSAPQQPTPQQEALQALRKQVKGNIESLVRCGMEEDNLKYEARKAALERALVWNENEHLKEFYQTEFDSLLVLSENNNLYEVKPVRSIVGASKDQTQMCIVYVLNDKLRKLNGGEKEYERLIAEEFKSYHSLYRRWEIFKTQWKKAPAEEKIGDELQWTLTLFDGEFGLNAKRLGKSLEMLSPQRENLIKMIQEADEKVQTYRQELKDMDYETDLLKAGQKEKPRKRLPKYVRTC